jgi:hypothetical protein
MTWLTAIGYLFHKWPRYAPFIVSTSRSIPRSWLITGFVTRITRRVALVEQELLTLSEHLSSPPVLSEVRVTRSLVLHVCFVDRCLSFCTFSFDHCVVLRFTNSYSPFGIFKLFLLVIISFVPWCHDCTLIDTFIYTLICIIISLLYYIEIGYWLDHFVMLLLVSDL